MPRTLTAVTLLALTLAPLHAEEVTITGRVVGPDGEAVAGAVVRVASDYYARSQVLFAETQGDGQGAFTLTFEDEADGEFYYVAAAKDGFVTGGDRLAPGEHVELRLSNRTTPVRGRVVDETGAPIEGAVIRGGNMSYRGLEGFASPTHHTLLKPTATTDADGRFVLRGLPDDAELSIEVDADGYGGWRGGAGHERFPVTHRWTVTLKPESVIAGRALAGGEPVEGVRIFARSQHEKPGGEGEAVTDAAGRFELRGLWGSTYDVMVDTGQEWIAPAVQGVTVEAGGRTDGIDVALARTTTVHVALIDAGTGEPVTGAYIRATSPARPDTSPGMHVAWTDESGHMAFDLPPGRSELLWTPVSGRGQAELEPNVIEVPLEAAGETMEVVVTVRPAVLASGMVTGPDGQPVAAAIMTRDGQTLATTDAAGRFRLKDTPEGLPFYGSVRGVVMSANEELVGVLRCDVGAEDVAVTLTAAAEMVLRIEDEEGNPVEGAELTVGEAEPIGEHGMTVYPFSAPFVSDADGLVRMGPLPSGVSLMPMASEKLRAMTPPESENWRTLQRVTLEPGETRDLGTIAVATRKRALSGIVLLDGQPHAGAAVLTIGRTQRDPLTTATDAEGRFRLDDLPAAGDLTLVALSADRDLAAGTTRGDEPAGPVTLELLPLSSARGTVTGADGAPLEGEAVLVSAMWANTRLTDETVPATLSGATMSDPDGGWDVCGLIAGFEYRVGLLERMHEGGPTRLNEFGRITPQGETEPFVVDIDLRPTEDDQ